MSKAILVMDMPIRCRECQLFDTDIEKCFAFDRVVSEKEINEHRSNWCPLKETPKKKDIRNANTMTDLGWIEGWNACINEILKGSD